MGNTFSCSLNNVGGQNFSKLCQNYNGRDERLFDISNIFDYQKTDCNTCRFPAEVFKLSEDHLQWLKLHPKALSITVNSKVDCSGEKPPLLNLSASDLEKQQSFSLPISSDGKFRRYSNRFVYWKATEKEVYALNVISSSDIDKLLAVAEQRTDDSIPQHQQNNFDQITKTTSQHPQNNYLFVSVHMAPVLSIRHGIIIESVVLTFTKCFLRFLAPDTIEILDEQQNCMFSTNATECVLSVDYAQLLLCVSFPSRALCFQFAEVENLRSVCSVLLNTSSTYLLAEMGVSANIGDDQTIFYQYLTRICALIDQINQQKNGKQKANANSNSSNSNNDNSNAVNEIKDEINSELRKYSHHRLCQSYQKQNLENYQNFCQRNNPFYCGDHRQNQCYLPYNDKILVTDSIASKNRPNISAHSFNKISIACNAKRSTELAKKRLATRNAAEPTTLLNLNIRPYEEVLHLLKYITVYRIASLKNLLPYSNFVKIIFPNELCSPYIGILSNQQYLVHYIHLNCILHSSFSLKRQLQLIFGRFTKNLPTIPLNNAEAKPTTVQMESNNEKQRKCATVTKPLLTTFQSSEQSVKSLPTISSCGNSQQLRQLTDNIAPPMISSSSSSSSSAMSASSSSSTSGDISYCDNSNNNKPKQQLPFGLATEKMNNSKHNLVRVIMELLSTEQIFVKDLKLLLEQYVQKLPTELRCLKGVIEELLKTHSNFLHSLQDACGEDFQNVQVTKSIFQYQTKDVITRIAALFVNKCDKFKIYCRYAAAYLHIQRLQQQNAAFNEQLQSLNLRGQLNESFESYLIKPIQRILKYPLFLSQINDYCEIGSIQRTQSTQALEQMQILATYLNKMQKIQEEYGETLEQIFLGDELINQDIRLDLQDLLMFAQLKWLRPAKTKSGAVVDLVDCVAFVFKFFVLLMENGNQKAPTNNANNFVAVLPMWRLDLVDNSAENIKCAFPQLVSIESKAYKTNFYFSIFLRPYFTVPMQHLTIDYGRTYSRASAAKIAQNATSQGSTASSRADSPNSLSSNSTTSSDLPLPPPSLLCPRPIDGHNMTKLIAPSQMPLSKTEMNVGISSSPMKMAQNLKTKTDEKLSQKLKLVKKLHIDSIESTQSDNSVVSECEAKFTLICCHIDIKDQFIRSVHKGQKICASHKFLRPTSQVSTQSDFGYYSTTATQAR